MDGGFDYICPGPEMKGTMLLWTCFTLPSFCNFYLAIFSFPGTYLILICIQCIVAPSKFGAQGLVCVLSVVLYKDD